MDINFEKIKEVFPKVAPEVRSALFSSNVRDAINEIVNKYELSSEQEMELSDLTSLTLLGLEDKKYFKQNLEKLGFESGHAQNVSGEILEQVIEPVFGKIKGDSQVSEKDTTDKKLQENGQEESRNPEQKETAEESSVEETNDQQMSPEVQGQKEAPLENARELIREHGKTTSLKNMIDNL